MKYLQLILPVMFLLTGSILSTAYAAEEGSLTVTTDPEGVEAWLGDKYIGDTPIQNKKLRAGRYTLKLIDPVQQVSVSEEILIQADKLTVVEKILKGKFGMLKVTSEPEGADVYISTSLGKTPLQNDFMNPGKYRIEIKHPKKKYQPIVENITIPQGKRVELTNTLVKESAFDTKAFVRILLGAGAIGGFVWAIVAQGNHKAYDKDVDYLSAPPFDPVANADQIKESEDSSKSAAVQRTLGIILGSVCVVGFEIVAFF
jgi:hypothetical protein